MPDFHTATIPKVVGGDAAMPGGGADGGLYGRW